MRLCVTLRNTTISLTTDDSNIQRRGKDDLSNVMGIKVPESESGVIGDTDDGLGVTAHGVHCG